MFQQIVLRSSSTAGPVTAGELAEAMLYYQKVHVVLDRPTFFSLGRGVGIDTFTRLICDNHITASFSPETLGAYSQLESKNHLYSLFTFTWAGDKESPPKKRSKHEAISEIVSSFTADVKSADRIAKALSPKLSLKKYSAPRSDFEIFSTMHADLQNKDRLNGMVRDLYLALVPGAEWKLNSYFQLDFVDKDTFRVDTNLNLAPSPKEPTVVYANLPNQFSLASPPTVSALIFELLNARADLNIALHYMSEFRTNAARSRVSEMIVASALARSSKSTGEISRFQRHEFEDACALAETINSGKASFSDFVTTYERSIPKFKEWLSSLDPDAELLAEYIKEVRKKAWFERMPGKLIRFASLGAFGTLVELPAELLAETADSFLLEQLIKGWRPNHFVDGPLRRFIEQNP